MFQYQSDRRPKLPRFDFRFGFRLLRLHPPREAHRSKAAPGAALAKGYGVVTDELRKGAGLRAGCRLLSSEQVVVRPSPEFSAEEHSRGLSFDTYETGTAKWGGGT